MAKTNSSVKVLENVSDHFESTYKGLRFKLEDLPTILTTKMGELENTTDYKEKGYVWFRLDTVGTDMHGYYKFNKDGKTLDEMFEPVKDDKGKTAQEGGKADQINKNWRKLNISERARFFKGDRPLVVVLKGDPGFFGGRVGVVGIDSPQIAAPVLVAKQAQAQAQPKR